jgi:FdhD protein
MMIIKQTINRISGEHKSQIDDILAKEVFYKLFLNGEYLNEFYCSPSQQNDLVRGYLFIRGHIVSPEEIIAVHIEGSEIKVRTESNSESRKQFTGGNPAIAKARISSIMKELDSRGIVFRQSGGTHIAGLYSEQDLICAMEDVSRHNAIMKSIGCGLAKSVDFSQSAIFVSCRITASIIDLISKTPLKMICSQSAATSLAIDKAYKSQISIIGFIRDSRMNLYTGYI